MHTPIICSILLYQECVGNGPKRLSRPDEMLIEFIRNEALLRLQQSKSLFRHLFHFHSAQMRTGYHSGSFSFGNGRHLHRFSCYHSMQDAIISGFIAVVVLLLVTNKVLMFKELHFVTSRSQVRIWTQACKV